MLGGVEDVLKVCRFCRKAATMNAPENDDPHEQSLPLRQATCRMCGFRIRIFPGSTFECPTCGEVIRAPAHTPGSSAVLQPKPPPVSEEARAQQLFLASFLWVCFAGVVLLTWVLSMLGNGGF